MTEATLNANNFIDIWSIPSKFPMCMYDRIKNVYAQIGRAYIVLGYGKPLIIELFEEPSYQSQETRNRSIMKYNHYKYKYDWSNPASSQLTDSESTIFILLSFNKNKCIIITRFPKRATNIIKICDCKSSDLKIMPLIY